MAWLGLAGHIKAEMLKCCAYAPLAACKFYILTGEWGSVGLLPCFSLCTALLYSCLLTLLACCSSIIATCRKQKPRARGAEERVAKGTCFRQTSQIKAAGHTIQKKPKSTGSFGVSNKLKRVPQVPRHVSVSFSLLVRLWHQQRRNSRSSFGPLSRWCCYDLMSLHQVTVMMEVHRERRAY